MKGGASSRCACRQARSSGRTRLVGGDEETRTLIPIGSPLHKQALALSTGQRVRFSGMFFPSKIDCMTETSLTVSGAMTEPAFLFRFSEIQPAE
jgi:hypothetical protein